MCQEERFVSEKLAVLCHSVLILLKQEKNLLSWYKKTVDLCPEQRLLAKSSHFLKLAIALDPAQIHLTVGDCACYIYL